MKKIMKKVGKKAIALLSCTALVTNIFASTADAIVMNSTSLIKDTYFKDKNKGFIYYTSEINDENGDVVYCVDSRKNFPTGENYENNNVADGITTNILKNGYPNKSITGDDKIDRIITQTAIWAHIDSENVDVNNLIGANKVNYVETENVDLTKAFKDFYSKCIVDKGGQVIVAEFKDTDLVFKQERNIFKSNSNELKIDVGSELKVNKNAKLLIESSEIKVDEILVKDVDGNQLPSGELPINKPFTMEMSIDTINKILKIDDFKIGAKFTIEDKHAVIWESPDSLIQNIVKLEDYEEEFNVDNKLNITGDFKGQIKIIKQDSSNNQLLNGAVFNIKDSQNNIVQTTKATTNGVILSNELPLGEYKLEETIAPQNYILSKNEISVNLNTTDVLEVIVKNDKAKGSVELTKIDKDDNSVLAGATFELYKEGQAKIAKEFITDENGIIKIENLEVGNYYFKETKAPNGYILDSNSIYNFVIKQDEITKITVKNTFNEGELFFTKTDVSTGDIIEGATIEIKGIEENNKDVKITFISSKDGNTIKLPLGKYQIKETIAPKGYVLSEEIGTFEIKNKLDVAKANLVNKPISFNIQITKLDSEDKTTVLMGAEFAIYGKDGKEVSKGTTDKNGQLKFENLIYDEYTIKEIKAPVGYKLNSKNISINPPDVDGRTVYLDIFNEPLNKGNVELTKVDKNNKSVLEGATFELYKEGQSDVIKTVTTDKNGIIKVDDLDVGKYYFKETKAPNGYILESNNKHNFEIKNNETTKLTVENSLNQGELLFTKTDATTGDVIDGATIEITGIEDINKDVRIEFISSKDGNKIKIPSIGKYQIKEIIAPNGYVLSEEVGTFEIKSSGEIAKANLVNKPILFNVEILKLDSEDKTKALMGADFTIYDKDGKEISKGTTDENGKVKFENLVYGEYTIKETKAPQNYQLNSNAISVKKPSKNGETIYVEVLNELTKGSVELTKIDKDDKSVLEGAIFELYQDGQQMPLASLTTNKDGLIKINDLKVGNYYFKEVQAPVGYQLEESNIYNFEIKNNEVIKIVVENIVIPNQGELFFTKTDLITGEVLDGATIEIIGVSEDNKDIKVEFISSKEGNKIKLPIGKYEIKETIAPNGYVLSEEIGTFEIKSSDEITKAELKNRPMLFHVEILKLDSKNKTKTLAGAEFTVYDKDGKELGKGTTDQNGKLRFENLIFGQYTIKETKAPTGYQLSKDSLSIKSPEKDGDTISIEVLNTPTKLVQTGGEVSNILIIGAGLALVVGGVIFIIKSKDNKDKKSKK